MDKSAIKRSVKVESQAVRDILMAWDPLGGSPRDEYDCLVDHIVSALHKGNATQSSIASLISRELVEHFGIDEPQAQVSVVAMQIAAYWEQH